MKPLVWFDVAGDLVLCAAVASLLWYPMGRWLLARLGMQATPLYPLALTTGLGMCGYAVLGLGTLGRLQYLWILGLAGIGLLVYLALGKGGGNLRKSGERVRLGSTARLLFAMFWIASAGCWVLVLPTAFAPELSFDALNVHLPYAREAAESHRIAFAPNNWSSAMPALPLMAYVTAFMLSGVSLAKLFNLLCYLLAGGTVYFFIKRWWGPIQGAAAALLFWSCPIALYEATTALIDPPFALFSTTAVLSLLQWTRSGDRAFLWLSAISLGFATGCKYHAVFWIPPVTLILTYHGWRVRGWGLLRSILAAVGYCAVVAALFAPWALRAWHYTGNPVFPAANSLFESPFFPPAMEAAAEAVYDNIGVGISPSSLLTLPWKVSYSPGPFRGTVGLLFLPGAALVLLRKKSIQTHYSWVLLALYFLAWALTAQEIRYLLPLIPLLAVLATLGFVGRSSLATSDEAHYPIRQGPLGRGLQYGGALVLLLGSLSSHPDLYKHWVPDWTYWHSYRSPWKYLMGKQSALQYLERDVPSIYVHAFANRQLSAKDRLLLLNDASSFYSEVPTLYSFTVEGERILHRTTEAALLAGLRSAGITHVLLNYNGLKPVPGISPRQGVYFFLDKAFQKRNLEAIHSENNVILFRVRAAS